MKPGMLCVLLLSACSFFSPSDDPDIFEYALTWYCVSPEGCEHTEELQRIDRMIQTVFYDFQFKSTQDESFTEEADRLYSDLLPLGCSWLYYISFFGHELEPSKLCYGPGGFELELSIPNQDPATHSKWVVAGRKLNLQ